MVPEKEELTKKRLLYIGSAVPLDTAEGLEAVQKPLSERYPVDHDDHIEGILSILSVTPRGLTVQHVSDPATQLFFPITSLTLCAAVRCVTTVNAATGERTSQFVSISSPAAGGAICKRPAIFTAVTRRTEGRKVLECHSFVCSSSKDAMELVQCTAFADRLKKSKISGAAPGAEPSVQHGCWPASRLHGSQTDTVESTSALESGLDVELPTLTPRAEGDHPVRLVPRHRSGEDKSSQRVAPEFFEAAPTHGYFYKTKDSQIKTYVVERAVEEEVDRMTPVPANMAAVTRGCQVRTGSVYAGPPPHRPRLLFASPSTRAKAMTLTLSRPQGRALLPVQVAPASTTLIQPRFFSLPPILQPIPVAPPAGRTVTADTYMFRPSPPHTMTSDPPMSFRPPVHAVHTPHNSKANRHRRSGSDCPSSSSDSSQEVGRRRVVNGDGSSDVSSRPRSPPADYDMGPTVDHKKHFRHSWRHLEQVNTWADNYVTQSGGPPPTPTHPYDFQHATYPLYTIDQAMAVPRPASWGKFKEGKKGRKGKKSGRRSFGLSTDMSTDRAGYTSEALPGAHYPRMPRDFRRSENQFDHERAFSQSLAEQFPDGPADVSGNAYCLNEHLASMGLGPEDDFSLY